MLPDDIVAKERKVGRRGVLPVDDGNIGNHKEGKRERLPFDGNVSERRKRGSGGVPFDGNITEGENKRGERVCRSTAPPSTTEIR